MIKHTQRDKASLKEAIIFFKKRVNLCKERLNKAHDGDAIAVPMAKQNLISAKGNLKYIEDLLKRGL